MTEDGLDPTAGHVIVCGMGQLGHCIVRLLNQLAVPVVCLTQGTRSDWLREAEAKGTRVVLADARDDEALRSCGIMEARSLIAATDHDAINIEVALSARALRPSLPVVIRVADSAVGAQLEEALGARRVLSMSALAAPLFVAGVESSTLAALKLGGELFVVADVVLGEQIGSDDLADGRISVLRGPEAGRPSASHAGADPQTPFWRDGESVRVLAPASAWRQTAERRSGPRTVEPDRRRGPQLRGLISWPRAALAIWSSVPLAGRVAVVMALSFTVLSVAVFQTTLGLSFLDSLYFVTTTITTTGYGDISPSQGPDHLKWFAILLMLVGSAITGVLYSVVTGFIVAERFRELLGAHRVPYAEHIIVAGLSGLGREICAELVQVGRRVAIVDRDQAARFSTSSGLRPELVIGDARTSETLMRAGAEKAAAILAVTDDDATNLAVGLAAKRVSPGIRTILRIFDPDFAEKVRSTLNIDLAVSAPAIAASSFVGAALHAGAVHAIALESELVTLVERSALSAIGLEGTAPAPLLAENSDGTYRSAADGGAAGRDTKVICDLHDAYQRTQAHPTG